MRCRLGPRPGRAADAGRARLATACRPEPGGGDRPTDHRPLDHQPRPLRRMTTLRSYRKGVEVMTEPPARLQDSNWNDLLGPTRRAQARQRMDKRCWIGTDDAEPWISREVDRECLEM